MTVDLLCMGEPMLEFNQLPPGADGTRHYLEGHGGDTSNAAIAAARQGARVGYITAIGQDMPGDSFMRLWAARGCRYLHCAADRSSPDRRVFRDARRGGASLPALPDRTRPSAMYAAADVPAAAIAAARIFYRLRDQPGDLRPAACDAVFAAIDVAERHGVKVAYDTNYRPRLWPPARAAAVMHAAMAQADYAMPGMEDVATLTGLTDPDAMLDFYLRLGVQVVVLKMGEQAPISAHSERRVRIPAA